MRVLGLDYGEKRIGVAVSDELGLTSQGLPTIARSTRVMDLKAVRDVASRHSCQTIVVGLPRNMDGSYGGAASAACRFAEEVKKVTGLPVELVDERMTTLIANRALIEAGESRASRKSHVDRLAAQLILQGYLDSMRQKQEKDDHETHSSPEERLDARGRGENKRALIDSGQSVNLEYPSTCQVNGVTPEVTWEKGDNKDGTPEGEEDIVILTDEDGEEHEFQVVDFIQVEGKDYAVLLPKEVDLDDEDEAIILRMEEDKDGHTLLVEIDEDDEWDRVAEAWEDLIEEEDETDEEPEGD